jgi:5-methylcytosine-specific restriction protein A
MVPPPRRGFPVIDGFYQEVSDAHVRREKERARALRLSRWWQSLIGQVACHYCGMPLAKKDVTMDHIVPVSQGGQSVRSNVVPACKACNTRKRDMTAIEWALHREETRLAAQCDLEPKAERGSGA